MTKQEILDFHKQQFPWQPGEDSENRRMYYFLSGFLSELEQRKQGPKLEYSDIPKIKRRAYNDEDIPF